MSHFSVVVIGEDPEAQLAPYHEFECAGKNDQYVVEVDRTEEARKEYAKHTCTRLKLKDGTLVDFFDDKGKWVPEYSQPVPDSRLSGIRGERTYLVPEGCEKVEVPAPTVMTFAQFCTYWYGHESVTEGTEIDTDGEQKFGYTLVDAAGDVIKTVKRTNPNAHWDWYSVGGRWLGFFKLKAGATGELGTPGVFDNTADAGTADVLRKGDIDWEGMRDEAGAEAGAHYDKVREVAGDVTGFEPWQAFYARVEAKEIDIEEARKLYAAQPQVQRLNKERIISYLDSLSNYLCTREEYVQKARNRAGVPFAVVKNGVWYEKGSMGWWGSVSDEKDPEAWQKEFAQLMDGLPDDTILTVVDCHI